jgi:hypothetical protein
VSENLHLEILSVAELIARGRIRSLGQVIDEFDDLKPELAGPVDPPRTPVPSVERHLVDWQSTIRPGDYYTQLFARDVIPPMSYGMLQVTGDIWGFPPYAPHRFEYGVEEAWLDDEAHIERVADFFGRSGVRRTTSSSAHRLPVPWSCPVCPGPVGTFASTRCRTSSGSTTSARLSSPTGAPTDFRASVSLSEQPRTAAA